MSLSLASACNFLVLEGIQQSLRQYPVLIWLENSREGPFTHRDVLSRKPFKKNTILAIFLSQRFSLALKRRCIANLVLVLKALGSSLPTIAYLSYDFLSFPASFVFL